MPHIIILTEYVRFANLTATQKGAARALWTHATGIEAELCRQAEVPHLPTPLVNCWFKPDGPSVSPEGFYERDPTAN